MQEHSINVGVGLDSRGLEAGAKRVEKAVNEMAGYIDAGTKSTESATFAFKSLQQALNTSVRDAEKIAATKGTESAAFREAAVKVSQYRSELEFAHIEMAKADVILRGPQAALSGATRSFNTLGYSIAQVTREMPAFAYSAQVGFLAISNNIPIVVDEINKLRAANAAMVAQGQPVKSLFSSIGAAIFSWQTVLSVGVTLMTIYGKEIIDWADSILFAKQRRRVEALFSSLY